MTPVIAIPSARKSDLLETCLLSIIRTTKSDFSVRVGCQGTPSEALNRVIQETAPADIVVCNDDVEMLTEGWLDTMSKLAVTKAPIVGCKLLSADKSTVLHGGGVLWTDDAGFLHVSHYKAGSPVGDEPAHDISRLTPFVTYALVYIKREVFDKVGLFDPLDADVQYNDVDFGLRCLEQGIPSWYEASIVAIHIGGASARKSGEFWEREKRDRVCIASKWGERWKSIPWLQPLVGRAGGALA